MTTISQHTTIEPSMELSFPSELGYEKIAREAVAAFARRLGCDRERVEDLKTALGEACINAIEHGNHLNDKLSVGVILSASEDKLEVKVIDEGSGISKKPAKPDIDRKMHGEEEARGLGMFLMQSLVDEAEWVKGSKGNGSYVRLVIRLDKES